MNTVNQTNPKTKKKKKPSKRSYKSKVKHNEIRVAVAQTQAGVAEAVPAQAIPLSHSHEVPLFSEEEVAVEEAEKAAEVA